ncbi:MAG: GTP-binding protein, partial [Chloroflexi bacterium]|nr:GTP-binding protein [Chloroflexota bacterium]
PNAGKSSLFNALLDRPRAIVTDEPGTTRDTLEETLDLDGMAVILTDTAGWPVDALRELGIVERIGVDRSHDVVKGADAVIHVVDGSDWSGVGFDTHRGLISSLASGATQVVAITKADLGADPALRAHMTTYLGSTVAVSAMTGEGIDTLRRTLGELALEATKTGGGSSPASSVVVTNPRHIALLASGRHRRDRLEGGIAHTGGGDGPDRHRRCAFANFQHILHREVNAAKGDELGAVNRSSRGVSIVGGGWIAIPWP